MSRMVLGKQADNTLALRTSAFGFDAFTAADDGVGVTFDSRWTNIAKLWAIGIATTQVSGFITGTPIFNCIGTYPDIGYKPFVEVRRLISNVMFDDFWDSSFPSGCYAHISSNAFSATPGAAGAFVNSGYQAVFAVYQIPVPSQ